MFLTSPQTFHFVKSLKSWYTVHLEPWTIIVNKDKLYMAMTFHLKKKSYFKVTAHPYPTALSGCHVSQVDIENTGIL